MPANLNVPVIAKRPRGPLWLMLAIAHSRPVRALGQLFYDIGFAGELIMLNAWRVAREGGTFFGQMLLWGLKSAGASFSGALRSVWQDFISPFVRIRGNLRTLKETKAADRARGEAATTAKQLGYFGRGLQNYLAVLLNILRYLLPLAAVVVLIITVNSLLGYRYALVVEMDGQVIGYVSDDMVVEEAIRVVQGRIRAADGKSGEDWRPEGITMYLSNVSSLTNKNTLVNNILQLYANSTGRPDALLTAYGLYVSDELYAVITEGERMQDYLDSLLAAQYDPQHPEAVISFAKNVYVDLSENQYYFAASAQDYDTLLQELTDVEYSGLQHTVQEGETLEEIAAMYELTQEVLLARNPSVEFAEDGDGVPIAEVGTELVIEHERLFLQVQKTLQISEEEIIPYETVNRETSERLKGLRATVQKGVDGVNRVYYDLVYIDGELVERVKVNEKTEVLVEPVTEIIEIGTLVHIEGGSVPSGNFRWPVPNYTGVTRGWTGAHKGLDITAEYGTPILAGNDGVVVVAQDSYYSYGICVIIEHDGTYSTLYGHMSAKAVTTGETVQAGQVIGYVGSTGRSTGNHCHFEVRVNGVKTDPSLYTSP